MKIIKYLIISSAVLFSLNMGNAFAQTTLVLQPDSTAGEDALVDSRRNTQILSRSSDFTALSGTNGGVPVIVRSLINFDLSSIPDGASIIDARLSLYSYNSSANGAHSKQSGTNACILQRITSSWSEANITWNNQPAYTSANEVYLDESQNTIEDYEDIDVTNLVQDMLDNSNSSYGFMMKLQIESDYRRLLFASSDNSDTTLHPKLVVSYELIESDSCIVLQPNNGKDALVDSRRNTQVLNNSSDYTALSGTNGGVPVIVRSLIEFDLSGIPTGATIDHAKLSLYSYTSSANGAHSKQSGSNACLIQRITESWDESTITWNNQPSSTSHGEIGLDESLSTIQDYTVIVTDMLQSMIDSPSVSHGFLMKLVNESDYRRLLFASSDNADTSLHPKLEICYTNPSASIHINKTKPLCQVYPNPSSGIVKIRVDEQLISHSSVEIYNAYGQSVKRIELSQPFLEMDLSDLASGLYTLRVVGDNYSSGHQLVLTR